MLPMIGSFTYSRLEGEATVSVAQHNPSNLAHNPRARFSSSTTGVSPVPPRQAHALSPATASSFRLLPFPGRHEAKKYIALTKTSKATATRDLQELTLLGALKIDGSGRNTRYRVKLESFESDACTLSLRLHKDN